MSLGPVELIIILLMCIPVILIVAIGVVLVVRRRDFITTRRVKCPYCAEWIMPEAKICRYCGRDLNKIDEHGNI